MLKPFHTEMMQLALDNHCSPRALKAMIRANLNQDRLLAQIGHDEYHFDNNAFEKSYTYIEEQRALTVSSLIAQDAPSAWSAFGRLTHTAQDFYAHSNYIDLWLGRQASGATPSVVDPIDSDLIHSPALRSGKVYVMEVLGLIPILRPRVLSLLPPDSHGRMSLDSPADGPNFMYAFQAAVKRTQIEFEMTTKDLSRDLFGLFVGK